MVGPVGEPFDHLGDFTGGEAEETMTALALNLQQAAFDELGKMGAGGLRRRPGQKGEFAGRAARAIGKLKQNGRAHGIADESADRGEIRRFGAAAQRSGDLKFDVHAGKIPQMKPRR
jgi:hypothetical protein